MPSSQRPRIVGLPKDAPYEHVEMPMNGHELMMAPLKHKSGSGTTKFANANVPKNEELEVVTFEDNPLYRSPFIEKYFKEGQFKQTYRIPGRDVRQAVDITLEDSYNGLTDYCVKYAVQFPCTSCARTCGICDGKGRMAMFQTIKGLKQKFEVACNTCRTHGYLVKGLPACQECAGIGYTEDHRETTISFYPGAPSGVEFTVENAGEQIIERDSPVPPGNRILVLNVVMPTPAYSRVGHHIKLRLPMTFMQTVVGARYELSFPYNKNVYIDTRRDLAGTIITPLTIHPCTGLGMPIWSPEKAAIIGYGDAILHFDIDYPKTNPDMSANDIDSLKTTFANICL